MSALHEVTLEDGRRWIGETANHASAVRGALAKLYPEGCPDAVNLTVVKLDGGAVIVPAQGGVQWLLERAREAGGYTREVLEDGLRRVEITARVEVQ